MAIGVPFGVFMVGDNRCDMSAKPAAAMPVKQIIETMIAF